jgi:hypothetical protein
MAFVASISITLTTLLFGISDGSVPQQYKANNVAYLAIIDKALNLIVPGTEIGELTAANDSVNAAFKEVGGGNYSAALALIVETFEQFPCNFYVQARLASILGDYAESFSGDLKEKMINKSKAIFSKLVSEVEGQSKPDYFFFKNEYYFRFGLYKEQYELGFEKLAYYLEADGGDRNKRIAFSYYTQGVGATNYAKKLLIEGKNEQLAHEYAQKAVVAWAQHFSYHHDYYNSYVHYALALGILGYKKEMMHALTHAAQLINKDLNFHEFKNVIDFIEKAHNS